MDLAEKDHITKKEKKLMESEDLNFLLQSGIVLCKLASIIVPEAEIEVHHLQVCFRIEAILDVLQGQALFRRVKHRQTDHHLIF